MTGSSWRWLIGGAVQGVGFRPFATAVARDLGLAGSVRNLGGDVEIVISADAATAGAFLGRILTDHPVTARPTLVAAARCAPPSATGFRILPSEAGGPGGHIPLDEPPCEICLAEMADPADRRYRYPFIACNTCGPRYTMMETLPFDRDATSMSAFALCSECRSDYEGLHDRRYHAQTISCPACGPRLTFKRDGEALEGNEAALRRSLEVLKGGGIVAVKGVGGYHLMCDAADDPAVRRLRSRKHRPSKPFAVLFPRAGEDGLDVVRRDCLLDDVSTRSLTGRERPIVILPRRTNGTLSRSLAPDLTAMGACLASSPLQELLAQDFGRPLVATSGNVSGEPVLLEASASEHRLGSIADAFLHHDRPILNQADDAVVRIISGEPRRFRIGRGNSPKQLRLSAPIRGTTLALGGQSKVTISLGFGDQAVISPHIGNLDSPPGLDRFEANVERLQRHARSRADILVCDAHPGYATSRWAARQTRIPIMRVPHHQAHASAVAAEFPHVRDWLCFTWDGAGLGEDGSIWGGEAFIGRPGLWRRRATFRSFAPPGGERASREPWRSAAAMAWELGIAWSPQTLDSALAWAAWSSRLNSPSTSSIGRLFDAAAAFLNIMETTSFEGEAAMAIEASASDNEVGCALPLNERADGIVEADWAPLVPMLLDRYSSISRRAARFHATLAATLTAQAEALRIRSGPFAVGLGGGVFQNKRLAELTLKLLEEAGFDAYLPVCIPCNDGGLSFGQLVEAAARR